MTKPMTTADSIRRGANLLHDSIVWGFDRSKYANASEMDTCIRKQWYGKNKPKAEEDRGRGYANRGYNIERWAIECMVAANMPVRFVLEEQVSLQDKERKISATGDGVLDWGDTWEPFDIKSIDPRMNKANLPKPHHVTQLKISMALINDQLKPDGVKMSHGFLYYVDASDYDKIEEFKIELDEGILEDRAKRAKKLLTTRNVAGLDREGRTRGGKECRTECGFKEICGVVLDGEEATTKKRANRGSSLDASAQQYMDLKTQMVSLKGVQDEVKETIKQELKKRDKTNVMVGDISVVLKTQTKTSLDKKAMIADGIDVPSYEKTGAPFEVLTVK